MQKLFIATICLFLTGTLFSQNEMKSNDIEAKKILRILTEQIKNYSSLKLNFSLKLEVYNGKIKILNEKKGTVWMKKEKYKVDIDEQEIFCNGTSVWNYDHKTKEVQITTPDPANKMITPQKLLSSFYDDNFLYRLNPPVRLQKQLYKEIEMTPIDKSKPFFKIYVYVAEKKKGNLQVYQIKVFEKNGNKYTYTMSKLVENKKIDDAFFEFKTANYPHVEVVDLR